MRRSLSDGTEIELAKMPNDRSSTGAGPHRTISIGPARVDEDELLPDGPIEFDYSDPISEMMSTDKEFTAWYLKKEEGLMEDFDNLMVTGNDAIDWANPDYYNKFAQYAQRRYKARDSKEDTWSGEGWL